MKKIVLVILLLGWVGVSALPAAAQEATATPSATAPPTVTATPTLIPTPTGTPMAAPTATPVPTGTATPTGTPTPTATVTPLWPTDTPTPTVTWTPTPACADDLEPNDRPGTGEVLVIDQASETLTLSPVGDVDFFRLWAKGGRFYQLTTDTSTGLDTRLRVFAPDGTLLAENDDYRPGNPASQVRFQAPGAGWFAVAVDSVVPTAWGCRPYSLVAVDISPPTATPTATPGPTATPRPTGAARPGATAIPVEALYDQYEPNYDFDSAANIGVGQTLSLNFNPYPAGSGDVDNDTFRLYVKVGEKLRLETKNLAAGLDTNLILYRANGEAIAGNDDCQVGQRHSCLQWSPDYTGVAYVLAGPVGTLPEAISAGARAYDLAVIDLAGSDTPDSTFGGTPTPAYGQPLPWPVTPLPPTPTRLPLTMTLTAAAPPTAIVTPVGEVRVRPFSLAPPPATPQPLQAVTMELMVYYDENDNRAPDISEGVTSVSVRVLDRATNRLLGHTFTDSQGHATISVSAAGEVRLSVPYLGYSQVVKPPGKPFEIRLAALRLPSLIP